MLTVRDVALLAHATENTVRLWVKVGKLPPPRRIGRRMLWPRAEIESLFATVGEEASHAG